MCCGNRITRPAMPGVDASYLRGDREFVDLDIEIGINSVLGVRSGRCAHSLVP
jgi:hypothetical protein